MKQHAKNILEKFYESEQFTCCICDRNDCAVICYSQSGRKRILCRCGARERQRGLYYTLLFNTDICNGSHTVLHTSPAFEHSLIHKIRTINPQLVYTTSDIKDVTCDTLLDLTNIGDEHCNAYNYIINIHVLEHLRKKQDVFTVIANLRRMLKVGGTLIIAVPQDINLDLEILEDPNADPNPDHWRKFGNKFINLLKDFSSCNAYRDTSCEKSTSKLIDQVHNDIFLGLQKNNYKYADGQIFYVCKK